MGQGLTDFAVPAACRYTVFIYTWGTRPSLDASWPTPMKQCAWASVVLSLLPLLVAPRPLLLAGA